jgi:hypothetical protein
LDSEKKAALSAIATTMSDDDYIDDW